MKIDGPDASPPAPRPWAGLQRVFAVLLLLRGVAPFLVVPVLLYFDVTLAGLPAPTMGTASWICFALAAGGAAAGAALYLLHGLRPSAQAEQRWMGGQQLAWAPPPLLAGVRHGPAERVPAGRLATALPGRGSEGLSAGPRRPVRGDRSGPVVFGYDGSELARAAIAAAGRQLPAGRAALVVTVWRTFDVEFIPEPGTHFDAANADEVKDAAEQTAAGGAALAEAAGFRTQALAVEGTPTWKAITDTADDHDASLIIVGSHGRTGFVGRLVGSVAAAVAAHSRRTVLIEHDHSRAFTFASGTGHGQPPEAARNEPPP
jgi:nucleotide-binding universal stress UspA family protein